MQKILFSVLSKTTLAEADKIQIPLNIIIVETISGNTIIFADELAFKNMLPMKKTEPKTKSGFSFIFFSSYIKYFSIFLLVSLIMLDNISLFCLFKLSIVLIYFS